MENIIFTLVRQKRLSNEFGLTNFASTKYKYDISTKYTLNGRCLTSKGKIHHFYFEVRLFSTGTFCCVSIFVLASFHLIYISERNKMGMRCKNLHYTILYANMKLVFGQFLAYVILLMNSRQGSDTEQNAAGLWNVCMAFHTYMSTT